MMLFALAPLRAGSTQVLETIRTVLVNDAAPDYPGLCRQQLNTRSPPLASAPDEVRDANQHGALKVAHDSLVQTLQEQEDTHRRKYQLPELRVIRPSAATWSEALQRRMREPEELLLSWKSVLYPLLPQVPIARGEASVHGARDEVEAPFREYAITVEGPIRDILDPVATAQARLEYRRRAAELLGNEPEATG
jgi:hypothetical protein